jgi:hypothetical protein
MWLKRVKRVGGQQERAEKYTRRIPVKETWPCVFACIEIWVRTEFLYCCRHLFNNAHLMEDGPPVLSEVLGTAAGELIDSDKRQEKGQTVEERNRWFCSSFTRHDLSCVYLRAENMMRDDGSENDRVRTSAGWLYSAGRRVDAPENETQLVLIVAGKFYAEVAMIVLNRNRSACQRKSIQVHVL